MYAKQILTVQRVGVSLTDVQRDTGAARMVKRMATKLISTVGGSLACAALPRLTAMLIQIANLTRVLMGHA